MKIARIIVFLFAFVALPIRSSAFGAAESVPKKTYQNRNKVYQKRVKNYQPKNTVRNSNLKKKQEADQGQDAASQGSRRFSALSSATRITRPIVSVRNADVPVAFSVAETLPCSSSDGCFVPAQTSVKILYSCQKGTVDVSLRAEGGDAIVLSAALRQGECRYDQTLKKQLADRKIAEKARKAALDFAEKKVDELFRETVETGTTCKILGQRLSSVQSAVERYQTAENERLKREYDEKESAKGDPCAEKP